MVLTIYMILIPVKLQFFLILSDKVWAGNKYKARCCMASRMEWNLPVKKEADWLGC